MSNRPWIVPTITQRVRRFLAGQGVVLRPWAGLEETYQELFALLRCRQHDPTFWGPLTELLQAIVDSASRPRQSAGSDLAQAELLASWDVRALTDELRVALAGREEAEPGPGPEAGRVRLSEFTGRLSAAVLGGFLLLGLAAAGCDEPASVGRDGEADAGLAAAGGEAGFGGSGGGAGDAGSAGGAGGADASVPPSCDVQGSSVLASTIEASSLSGAEKQALRECFENLGTSWCEGLTELFETGTPEQIATALEEMLFCCQARPAVFDEDYAAAEELLLARMLCPVPIYKGVPFPG